MPRAMGKYSKVPGRRRALQKVRSRRWRHERDLHGERPWWPRKLPYPGTRYSKSAEVRDRAGRKSIHQRYALLDTRLGRSLPSAVRRHVFSYLYARHY